MTVEIVKEQWEKEFQNNIDVFIKKTYVEHGDWATWYLLRKPGVGPANRSLSGAVRQLLTDAKRIGSDANLNKVAGIIEKFLDRIKKRCEQVSHWGGDKPEVWGKLMAVLKEIIYDLYGEQGIHLVKDILQWQSCRQWITSVG